MQWFPKSRLHTSAKLAAFQLPVFKSILRSHPRDSDSTYLGRGPRIKKICTLFLNSPKDSHVLASRKTPAYPPPHPAEILISLAPMFVKMVANALEIIVTDEGCHLSPVSMARKWKSTQIIANIQPFYFTNENSWFLSLKAISPPLLPHICK